MAGVEVDFLARDRRGMLHIIEVKSAGALKVDVLSPKQLKRLERAALVLSQREPVGLVVLVVMSTAILPIRV